LRKTSISRRTDRNVKAWQDVTVTANGIITSTSNFNLTGSLQPTFLKEGRTSEVKPGITSIASDLMTFICKPVKAVFRHVLLFLKMIEPSQNELQTHLNMHQDRSR
jgi:hypothetical protein